MEETHKFFEPTPSARRDEPIVPEPDATLVTPRFDEVEAQVARPVVPLTGRPSRVGGSRRQWPIALVLISALAGGIVSILAFRLYQQRQQQTQAVASEVDGRTQATEASASPAPEGVAAAAGTEQQQAQSDAPVVFEEFDPAKEGGAVSDAEPSRGKATPPEAVRSPERRDEARDESKVESKPGARAAETPKARKVETIPAPRQIEARHDDVFRGDDGAEADDINERRRERRRQRREQRREQRRNIDRIKDIFEGTPPG